MTSSHRTQVYPVICSVGNPLILWPSMCVSGNHRWHGSWGHSMMAVLSYHSFSGHHDHFGILKHSVRFCSSSVVRLASQLEKQSSGWLHARRTPELYPNSAGCLQHPSVIIIVLEPSITPKSPLVYDVYIKPKNSLSNSVAPLRVHTFLLSPCISLMCFFPWWPFWCKAQFRHHSSQWTSCPWSKSTKPGTYMQAQDIASLSWCWIVVRNCHHPAIWS